MRRCRLSRSGVIASEKCNLLLADAAKKNDVGRLSAFKRVRLNYEAYGNRSRFE